MPILFDPENQFENVEARCENNDGSVVVNCDLQKVPADEEGFPKLGNKVGYLKLWFEATDALKQFQGIPAEKKMSSIKCYGSATLISDP